jgi:hypothetical protein
MEVQVLIEFSRISSRWTSYLTLAHRTRSYSQTTHLALLNDLLSLRGVENQLDYPNPPPCTQPHLVLFANPQSSWPCSQLLPSPLLSIDFCSFRGRDRTGEDWPCVLLQTDCGASPSAVRGASGTPGRGVWLHARGVSRVQSAFAAPVEG